MKNTGNLLKDSNLCQEAKDSQKKTAVKVSSPRSEVDIQKLIQELEVHQIELEMQNEELRRQRKGKQNLPLKNILNCMILCHRVILRFPKKVKLLI